MAKMLFFMDRLLVVNISCGNDNIGYVAQTRVRSLSKIRKIQKTFYNNRKFYCHNWLIIRDFCLNLPPVKEITQCIE
jgi:hypothetical protein